MAWIVTLVLLAEAVGIAAVNWLLGTVVDHQQMSLAGLDPAMMATSSKAGGVVFGLYFALCALAALLVAVRDRAPAGLGRVLLVSAAVVNALLGAVAWGLVGPEAFLTLMVVLALLVLLLMTYDRPRDTGARPAGDPPGEGGAPEAAPGPRPTSTPAGDAQGRPADTGKITRTAPTTP
ncbi:hypothetical protein ACFWN1_16195 [Streptomyces sp. NPDC058459]|uniref:hypothetical protein n=1 Tax=Streptomyces sp. NPDC058459 TaxID=3346508 RepID=UPI00365FF58E